MVCNKEKLVQYITISANFSRKEHSEPNKSILLGQGFLFSSLTSNSLTRYSSELPIRLLTVNKKIQRQKKNSQT